MDWGDNTDDRRAPPFHQDYADEGDDDGDKVSQPLPSARWSPLTPSSLSHSTTATSAKDLSSTSSSSNDTPLSPPSPLSPYPSSAVLHHRRQLPRSGFANNMSLPLLAHQQQHPHHHQYHPNHPSRPRFPKRKASQLLSHPSSSTTTSAASASSSSLRSCPAASGPPKCKSRITPRGVLSRLLAGVVVARFAYAVFWMHRTMDLSSLGAGGGKGDAEEALGSASAHSLRRSPSDSHDPASAMLLLKRPPIDSARRVITVQNDPRAGDESASASRNDRVEIVDRRNRNKGKPTHTHRRSETRRKRTTPVAFRAGDEPSTRAAGFRHDRHMDARAAPLLSHRNAARKMSTLCRDADLAESSYLLVLGVDGLTTSFLSAAARHCGVKHVMLIDPIVPNLRKERLKALQRHVRALHRSDLGLNLDFRIPSTAGEPLRTRWFKTRLVTHVIQFQSPSSYDDNHPVLSKFMGESSHALFHMHQSLLAWDQALMKIRSQRTPGRKPSPHVMYVSLTGEEADGNGRSRSRHNRRQLLQQHLAQVLSRAYHAAPPEYQLNSRLPVFTHLEISADAIVGPYCSDAHSSLSGTSRVMYVTEATVAMFEALAVGRQQSASPTTSSVVNVWKTSSEREDSVSFADWTMLMNAPLVTNANISSPLLKALTTQDWIASMARHELEWRVPMTFINGKPPAPSVAPLSDDGSFPLPVELSKDLVELKSPTFPCSSSCRSSVHNANACQPSAWELLRPLSRKATAGCTYVTYVVILDPDLDEMPEPSSGRDKSMCRVAFVHVSSRLVQQEAVSKWKKEHTNETSDMKASLEAWNGRIQSNQWTLIWMNNTKELSLADAALLKIDPSRMFADSVKRTLYAEYFDYVKPSDITLARVIRNVDRNGLPWRRHIERRSGVPAISRWSYLEPEPAKRSILFAMEPLDMPRGISDFVKKAGNTFFPSQQLRYYEQLAHAVQVNDFRPESEIRSTVYNSFPLEWVSTSALIHDLVSQQAQELRCRWYDEYLHWGGNRDAEELSLSMVLATMRISGELGLPVSASVDAPYQDVSWYPILNSTDGSRQSAKLNDKGETQEFFVRVMRHRKRKE